MRNMASPIQTRRRSLPAEEGYILIWVIFLLAILTLSLTVAVPRVAKEIQRDRELETMHRGKQYARAIQLYYRKFHAYPPTVDALVNTDGIRFLRKKYVDPMTRKDDWKPILYGQNKTQPLGFFGQPLAAGGATLAGIGPSGGNGLNGAPNAGAPGSTPGSTSMFSPADPGLGSGTATPPAGSSPSSPSGDFTSTLTAASSSTAGPSGQTFGGAGIIGFSPADTKQSILVFKKKDHYNEWEFVYFPALDITTQPGGGAPGQPAAGMSSPIGGSPSAPGSPTTFGPGSSTTFGPSSGSNFGSGPSQPTTPAPPQQ